MTQKILVVDDERTMGLAMSQVLDRRGFEVDRAESAAEALSALTRKSYGAVVTDLRMPGMDGHTLLRRIRSLRPRTRVLVVTAYATVENAVKCVRDGAVDYLMKPFSPDALEKAVTRAVSGTGNDADEDAEDLVAEDPAMLLTVERATRAAASDATVLLEAESGAGKEIFARLIHRQSPRAAGPFVAVNCAALPRELLEAELFGHSRGAFTGAHRDRKGHFQLADGGTLLLDEIGEMDPDLQARLLRVLQDRLIQPIGVETPVRVDVRVIAATNRNLRHEVAAGRFREDLYYRLRVLPLYIPALREHPADIEPLARRFARRYAGRDTRLTAAAVQKLVRHEWPGNVRELQNAFQRAAILACDGPIEADHLELDPPLAPESIPPRSLSLDDAERDAIARILVETRGNRTEAAAALGISPRTLRHKLKRYRDEGRPVLAAGRQEPAGRPGQLDRQDQQGGIR